MNNNQPYRKTLWASVCHHLKQIPYILWYPLATILHLLFSLVSCLYNCIKDHFYTSGIRQQWLNRMTRKAVHTVLSGNTNIMNTFWSARVCYFLTFLLQFLSFLTTYAGFTFFLKHISPFAPIALAVVTQGTAYYLLNCRSSRKRRGNGRRFFLLCVVLLLSSTTSFVGVSNTIRSPVNDMKHAYEHYASAHNEQLDSHVSATNMFTQDDIENTLQACAAVYGQVDHVLELIQNATPQSTQNTTNNYSTTQSLDGGMTYTSTQTTSQNAELVAQKAALDVYSNDIQYCRAQVPSTFDNFSPQDIYTTCIQSEDAVQSGVYQDFLACLTGYDTLEQAMIDARSKIDASASVTDTIDLQKFSPDTIKKYHSADSYYSGSELRPYEDIVKDIQSNNASGSRLQIITNALNDLELLLVSPELTYAETIRSALNDEMSTKHALLSVSDQAILREEFEQAKLPNSQIYPLLYLLDIHDADWGSSIIAVILAALIDLLSVLLSWSLIIRRDSVLYARNHKESVGSREEILEDCYTYLCLRALDDPSLSLRSTAEIQTQVARIIEQTMRNFMRKIHVCYLPDQLDSFGYIPDSDLNKIGWPMIDLFQTLRLIHLIRPVTKKELTYLLNHAFPATDEQGGSTLPQKYLDRFPNEVLYVVDNRLLMWHNENFSELLQSNFTLTDVFSPLPDPNDTPFQANAHHHEEVHA